eukprot:360083-Pleurochrysis_carterae.AAC.2
MQIARALARAPPSHPALLSLPAPARQLSLQPPPPPSLPSKASSPTACRTAHVFRSLTPPVPRRFASCWACTIESDGTGGEPVESASPLALRLVLPTLHGDFEGDRGFGMRLSRTASVYLFGDGYVASAEAK